MMIFYQKSQGKVHIVDALDADRPVCGVRLDGAEGLPNLIVGAWDLICSNCYYIAHTRGQSIERTDRVCGCCGEPYRHRDDKYEYRMVTG